MQLGLVIHLDLGWTDTFVETRVVVELEGTDLIAQIGNTELELRSITHSHMLRMKVIVEAKSLPITKRYT